MDNKMRWSSDWNGYEVGYDNIDVVSLYTIELEDDRTVSMYVDSFNNKVLEAWLDEEE